VSLTTARWTLSPLLSTPPSSFLSKTYQRELCGCNNFLHWWSIKWPNSNGNALSYRMITFSKELCLPAYFCILLSHHFPSLQFVLVVGIDFDNMMIKHFHIMIASLFPSIASRVYSQYLGDKPICMIDAKIAIMVFSVCTETYVRPTMYCPIMYCSGFMGLLPACGWHTPPTHVQLHISCTISSPVQAWISFCAYGLYCPRH